MPATRSSRLSTLRVSGGLSGHISGTLASSRGLHSHHHGVGASARGSGNLRASGSVSARRRARASLRFSRLRTAHDCTIRDIVASSWDEPNPHTSSSSSAPGNSANTGAGGGTGAANNSAFRTSDASSAFASASGLHAPAIVPAPLGKRWSNDVLAVVHNAVRAELSDLFDVLSCMLLSASLHRASVTELQAFFAWYSTFEAFVVTALKAEEEVLYPWLEQWGRIEGSLGTGERISAKGAIIRGIRDVSTCAAMVGLHNNLPAGVVLTNPDRHYYDGLKVGFAEVGPSEAAQHGTRLCADVLRRVSACVSTFSTALVEYFAEQERALPAIIESLYDAEDVRAAGVEKRTLRALRKCGRKDESVVLVARAFEDRVRARMWERRALTRIERVALPLWKRRYVQGRGAVVDRFRERRNRYEQLKALHAGDIQESVEEEEDNASAQRFQSQRLPRHTEDVRRTRSDRLPARRRRLLAGLDIK